MVHLLLGELAGLVVHPAVNRPVTSSRLKNRGVGIRAFYRAIALIVSNQNGCATDIKDL